jgi:hypothetical protein
MNARKTTAALAAMALVGSVGCGRQDGDRIAALERRIASLEAGGSAGPAGTKGTGPETSGKPATDDGKAVAHHGDWKGVPLDAVTRKGIEWLVSVQGDDGGFGQDGGHKGDARDGVSLESQGNDVANTAMVGLALVRAGVLPTDDTREGRTLRRAVEYVVREVEASPEAGLAVTARSGTQIQRKLGRYVDTFLGSMLLTQVDGRVGDGALPARVRDALKKTVAKIERHQQADGSWNDGGGWAPVLATSFASNSLAQAKGAGIRVNEESLRKVEDYTKRVVAATPTADMAAAPGGAGVALYGLGQAYEQLSRDEKSREANSTFLAAAETRLADETVLSGFGSMGGEEFVSYMNVSDSLRRTGGERFRKWNEKIVSHLGRLQNQDGTWAGHHCITGRVACTSAAVLTILAERAAPRADR